MDSFICRICLDNTGTASVFDKETDGIQYSTKIMRLVNLTISEDDGLPGMLCVTCINELSLSYQFVQKLEASDKTLRCISSPLDFYSDIEIKPENNYKNEVKEETQEIDNQKYIENDFFTDSRESSDQKEQFNVECNKKSESKQIVKSKFRRKRLRKGRMEAIQCVICGLMVSSPSAMITHMRTHTGEKPYACTSCSRRFPTKGGLKRHNETYHSVRERKFTCETCGNSFFRKNDIVTHMRVHTDEKPYVCHYCSKRFRQVASRNRHHRMHTGEKPFSCPICGKRFSDKNLVKKHQSVHSEERKYTCHLCNKAMKSRATLHTHIGLHTNKKQNVCSFCGMAFAMKGNLQTHTRRVHSEKSGQCSICLKTFSDLEVHMRKHTGEKPYTCEMCNAAFAAKRSLAHHVLFKHENAGKFKCSMGDCTKSFPVPAMLEFHLLKEHTNQTPYICQHCSRGFFRNSDLSRHLRVSHMDVQIKASLKAVIV